MPQQVYYNYRYTPLDQIQQIGSTINVYAVIRCLSIEMAAGVVQKVKMLLQDASKKAIYCQFKANGMENYGDISLANDMIIRIHGCKVLSTNIGLMYLSGEINCGGFHIAAWSIFGNGHFRTSQAHDAIDDVQLNKLRCAFWKQEFEDDDLKMFFLLLKNGTISTSTHSFEEENQDANTSFDEFTRPRRSLQSQNSRTPVAGTLKSKENDNLLVNRESPKDVANQPSTSAKALLHDPSTSPIVSATLRPDADFLDQIRVSLKEATKQSSTIPITIRQFSAFEMDANGRYYDIVCMILAVIVPDDEYTENPVYLRVCDGTCFNNDFKGFSVSIGPIYKCQSDFFSKCEDDYHYQNIKEFVHQIGCFDEHGMVAKRCKPGDIVEIRNIRAVLKNGENLVSLHGVTPASRRYNRGINKIGCFPVVNQDEQHPTKRIRRD